MQEFVITLFKRLYQEIGKGNLFQDLGTVFLPLSGYRQATNTRTFSLPHTFYTITTLPYAIEHQFTLIYNSRLMISEFSGPGRDTFGSGLFRVLVRADIPGSVGRTFVSRSVRLFRFQVGFCQSARLVLA